MLNVPTDVSIDELFTSVLPKITTDSIAASGAASILADTEISMSVDISGKLFSYTIKNGTEVDIKEGALDSSMVKLKVSTEDMEKMIKLNELDIILLVLTDINQTKYETLKLLKGSFIAVLANDDGSAYNVEATFNDADDPKATFKMKTTDTAALVRKEDNPVNLFMSGAMEIEGDMAFAMATQPLFT